MLKNVRWKRFSRAAYAIFSSLKKEVVIGVLTAVTLTFANLSLLSAQNRLKEQVKSYALEEVEVLGSRVSLTMKEIAKQVLIISQEEIQTLGAQSVNDLLKFVASVDVRQRGAFGIQTDLSIRGGTFDQLTLLLNGVNISNSQTGHLSMDLPVSVDQIERIEILQGPAARIFGTSAFSGAINIITKDSKNNGASLSLQGGQYGTFGVGADVSHNTSSFSHIINGSYNRSNGAVHNNDFKQGKGFYHGSFTHPSVRINWQLGVSDQQYGANTFYSASYPNQYEETRRYFVSLQGETNGVVQWRPMVYWNRGHDHFELIKGTETGENFHQNDTYGVGLNGSFSSRLGKTGFGVEIRNEGILSTNLGRPLGEDKVVSIPGHKGKEFTKRENRTNVSYFMEQNFIFSQFTLSVGVLATMNTYLGHNFRYYPGVDLAYCPTNNWKVFASWNKALRLPTFTDLFYKSPTQEGNQNLKPEKTEAYSVGVHYRTTGFRAEVSSFYQRGRDMIDWVMFYPEDVYHSTNFKLNSCGFDVSLNFLFSEWLANNNFLKQLSLQYAYISQTKNDEREIYKSNYALEYLRHKFVGQLSHRIYGALQVSWSVRWQDRMGGYVVYDEKLKPTDKVQPYGSHALVDLKLEWDKPKYMIYATLNNLFNRTYYDYGNIEQPGFWINAGVKLRVNW